MGVRPMSVELRVGTKTIYPDRIFYLARHLENVKSLGYCVETAMLDYPTEIVYDPKNKRAIVDTEEYSALKALKENLADVKRIAELENDRIIADLAKTLEKLELPQECPTDNNN